MHAVLAEDGLHLEHVVICGWHDRYNQDLTRAEPEWPFSSKVLSQDRDEALEAAINGAVNHHRAGTARCELSDVIDFWLGVWLGKRCLGCIWFCR